MPSITIKAIEDPEKYWEIVDLMIEVWGIKDYREVVAAHMLRAAADNGGLVLAAYKNGEMIGFIFGIPAIDERGRLYHYSHMLGVKKEYRGTGAALKLKMAQRDFVLRQGLDLVMWTFDPQQGRNANFNFAKLGVICRRFYRNYYGTMRDEINRGLVSDRFKVEWWIKSKRVEKRLSGEFPPPRIEDIEGIAELVVKTREIAPGVRKIEEVILNAEDEILLVEIPANVDRVRDYSLELANDWRLKLRPVFEGYFSKGYIAVEFISHLEKGERRNYYLFWRTPLEEVLDGGKPWR